MMQEASEWIPNPQISSKWIGRDPTVDRWERQEGEVTQECPNAWVVTGLESRHSTGEGDRQYRLHCEKMVGIAAVARLEWSEWQSDQDFNPPKDVFIVAMQSSDRDDPNGRRFRFETRRICKDMTSKYNEAMQ